MVKPNYTGFFVTILKPSGLYLKVFNIGMAISNINLSAEIKSHDIKFSMIQLPERPGSSAGESFRDECKSENDGKFFFQSST